MADPADVTNVIRGHKAAIHNPNVSEEAKEHSRQVLEELEGKESTGTGSSGGSGGHKHASTHHGTTSEGKDPGNVARGLKAAIHNPNVSEEAKQHSRQALEELEGKDATGSGRSGGSGGRKQTSTSGGTKSHDTTSYDATAEGKDPGNVARGLKAAIHNPGVSEEAKERAKERLAQLEGQ